MGLKYTGSFDSIRNGNSRYVVNIYQDSYTGDPITVILGATPVVQEWQEDDPLAPIKGCTLTINVTTSGGLSLLDFYSDNDNEYLVRLIGDDVTGSNTVLFEGYILQDDCSEVQLDFVHEITLTATDNLGTIKDINLDRAAFLFGDVTTLTNIGCAFVPAGPYIVINVATWNVQPGQTFTIDGTTFTMVANLGEIDLVYTGWCIQIIEEIPALVIGTFDITYREVVSLEGYIPLITFIKLCLRSTYLDLPLSVINHIAPADGVIFLDTGETRIFEDVLLLSNTFLKDNEYMSCYDVLEIIMKRFNMSCFQSLNSWWIVRYPDLFLDYEQDETLVDYYKYEETTFAYLDKFTINKSFVIDSNNKVETGLLKSIIRPYRRTLESFAYVQPEDLICNSQFTDLGPLINTFTTGTDTVRKYEANCWFDYNGTFDYRIITIDNINNEEIERYFTIEETNLGEGAKSNNIILKRGDSFEYSFSVRAETGVTLGIFRFILPITDGIDTYYLDNNGDWSPTITLSTLTHFATGSSTDWQLVTKKAKPVPIDCVMNIILNAYSDRLCYKDLRLKLIFTIAGQGQINGHSHNVSQSKKLNNVNDVEVFIDNSERSSISGTLFENRTTGLLQDKITNWKFGYGYNTGVPSELYPRLGELITKTYMFQRYKPRTKFNGNLLSIRNANGILSNLAIFSNEFAGDLQNNKMLLGSVAIDYKNDSAEFTMWEVFNSETGYVDNFTDYTNYLFNILYQFNYLYENN
jgi:hypothetical protein